MTTKEFNQMYLDNKNEIFNYVNWKLRNVHDSEDLTATIFTKAHRLIYAKNSDHKFNSAKSDIKTWLRTIANCAIIDFYRTDHSDKYLAVSDFVNAEGNEVFQFMASKTENADFNIENDVLKARLKKAFSTLKPKYRRIAILYFLNDRDYSKIAEMCNVPMGTVKGMINRVREMLQTELADLYTVRTRKTVEA
jgi:RNA polymerase sigma-70 factor (ECF subfamily)